MPVILIGILQTLAVRSTAEQPSALREALEQELGSTLHETRVPLGTVFQYYDQHLRRNVFRLVDTEVYPDGDVKYLCTKAMFNMDGSPVVSFGSLFEKRLYLDPKKIPTLPVKSQVRIASIEEEKDRLELKLDTTDGGRSYAKIKLMLGKDFWSRYATSDSVMAVLSRVLIVEAYERRRQLQEELAASEERVETTRSAYKTTIGDSLSTLRAAEAHRDALLDAERIAKALGESGSGSRVAELEKERAAIDEQIIALTEATRVEQRTQLQGTLASVTENLDKVLAQIRNGSKREEDVLAAGQLLARRAALLDERASLGEPRTEEERGRETRDQQTVQAARDRIEAEKRETERSQRLGALENEYVALAKHVAAARESYGRAFGTAQQGQEAMKLRSALQRAYENRIAAGDAGSPQAAAEAKQLQRELQRLKVTAR